MTMNMKILILNYSDIEGGAAKAAYRLHRGLLQIGINSVMLVQRKNSDDLNVIGPVSLKKRILRTIDQILDNLPMKIYKNRTDSFFSPALFSSSRLIKKINELNPDIVHLHWIGFGMIKINDLCKIKKPIVWSLHDAWAFTGGCHYMGTCINYRTQCGSCPILNTKSKIDLSHLIFKHKKRIYSKIGNLNIIGLSKWLTNCAKKSALFKDRRIINLPNMIDVSFYKPIQKKIAKNILDIKNNKKIIVFGAIAPTSDPRKGFLELEKALKNIKSKNIELLIFGTSDLKYIPNFQFKTRYLGKFYDELSMKIIYSAADVVIVPSLQENLSNVIMESLSCGTPVVGFNIGGNSDMIGHKTNGYLADPSDILDLANGIDWVIKYSNYNELSQNARQTIVNKFSIENVAEKYKNLYSKILNC